MKEKKVAWDKYVTTDRIVFAVLLIGYFSASLYLFFNQIISNNTAGFESDMYAYIDKVRYGKDYVGYKFPYPVLFSLARLIAGITGPEWGLALSTAILNAITPIAVKYVLDRVLKTEFKWEKLISTIATFVTVTISMIYPLTWIGKYNTADSGVFLDRYLGAFTPNPYHNATSLAAKGFSIFAFYFFCRIACSLKEKWISRDYVLFSLFLLLATMAKPSFTLVFMLFSALYFVGMFVKERFKNFRKLFILACYYIPTVLALLYQYSGVFRSGGGDGGIGIGAFTAWSYASDNILVSVLYGTAFSIVVLLFNLFRLNGKKELLWGWLFYICAFITLAFFYEKGLRLSHINFAWGYMSGLFFLHFASIITLLKETFSKERKAIRLVPQYLFLLIHFICGIDYLTILLKGGLFH